MSPGHRAHHLPGVLAAAATLAWLAGCAPHVVPPPRVDRDEVRERFDRALAGRSRPAVHVESEAVVWLRAGDAGDLPGVQARVFLGAPDSMRVRFQSAFGTALDVVARGDSMTAWVPAARMATALDATADSLGVALPGALGYRLWSAAWEPPSGAWPEAGRSDSTVALVWDDAWGHWSLDIGRSGLPSAVLLETLAGRRWEARYPAWTHSADGPWPARVEVDAPGDLHMTAKLQRTRTTPAAAGRFALRVPARTRFVERGELVEMIEGVLTTVGGR